LCLQHISDQLPVAQRLAWAIAVLSPEENDSKCAVHWILSVDLIEMVATQVGHSRGSAAARGSSGSAAKGEDAAPAVRALVWRLWRRSCWYAGFHRSEEASAERLRLARAKENQSVAARHRRDRQVAAAQAVLCKHSSNLQLPGMYGAFLTGCLRLQAVSRRLSVTSGAFF
jgi:hypothetical protein